MGYKLKKEIIIQILLTLGVFYFSFMILDRALSLIYGFNFQPFGSYMPPGFTFWGHFFNGSLAAFGLFLTFKLYRYGEERKMLFLQVLALIFFFTVGAIIPYLNDAHYIASQGMGSTIPVYIVANDLYVFFWGLLMFRIVKPIKNKAIILGVMFVVFLLIHFVLYAPMFPEFYWS